MRHAIKTHRGDFLAVAVLVVLAIATVGYILEHQPSFTFGRSYYQVNAVFATAAAVTPGQGQSVTIAGVEVGLVGGVQLEHGQAVVTMDIFKRYAPIYRNATVLLRPRTPLKDMYLSLYPGTPSAGRLPAGGTLGIGSTQPDIDVDQILDSLDADTRTYLLLLLAGGAQAFNGKGATANSPSAKTAAALAADFKRFAPLDRSALDFTKLLAERSANLSTRSTTSIWSRPRSAASTRSSPRSSRSRTQTSRRSPRRTRRCRRGSRCCLARSSKRPRRLRRSTVRVRQRPGAKQLEPFAKDLGPALDALQPLAKDTTPAIEHQLGRSRPTPVSASSQRRSRRQQARWPRRRRRCRAPSGC